LISTPPTNTFEVSGSGKIVLKSTRFAAYPILDTKTFAGAMGNWKVLYLYRKKCMIINCPERLIVLEYVNLR
jgi:hypothetical protein